MFKLLLMGLLLGLGAAIPIGPVNLEIIRRNIRLGTSYGMMLGLGACGADLTYLLLLCIGAFSLAAYPTLLRIIGFIGSCILLWFAIKIFRSTLTHIPEHKVAPSQIRTAIEGYVMTLFNPFTILFWASVGSQLSLTALSNTHAMIYAGIGVLIGVVGWVVILNGLLHITRHRLSPTTIHRLNYLGGFILLGFAIAGMLRAFGLIGS